MSSPEQNQTQLTNPPSAQTQMTNPPKQVKMVKIRAIHSIRVLKDGNEYIVQPKEVIEVTESEAKEFCDKKIDVGFKGKHAGAGFGSHHPSEMQKTFVVRAERVKS